jgi:FkbM family methyltransferase
MTLLQIINEYKQKKLNKAKFIKKIYKKCHHSLFEYSNLIKKTDVKKIEITDSGLSMISKRYGIKVFFPRYDHRSAPIECINFGNYEKKELDALVQIMPKKGNFLDIGANIGWHSLIIAKSCKNLQVHSFEPIKKTYNFLLKNIKSNFLKNIKAYSFGFYHENKEIPFYTYPEGSGNSSICNLSNRRNIELQKAKVKILDDFINEKKIKVDFIKCDVEGAELFVFLGARKVLSEHKPIVFCEMLRKWCQKFKYHPNQIILLFDKFGYKCFYINNLNNKQTLGKRPGGGLDRGSLFKKFRLKEIKKITDRTKETNFLFIHKEKYRKIKKNKINFF